MRGLRFVAVAASILGACGADDSVTDIDADEAVDSSTAFDAADAPFDDAPEVDLPDCSPPVCTAPCVFDFRAVSADRDGVSEVRIAAGETPGSVLAVALTATPSWVRFSDGFAQYIARVTAGDWVVAEDRLSVAAGAPIEVPAGESFVVELRADDPGAATCEAGACGTVTITLGDCANGQVELGVAVIR